MSLATRYGLNEVQLSAFTAEIDAIRRETMSDVGERDLSYMKQLNQVADWSEVGGRLLLHFSLDPVSWSVGVAMMSNYYAMKTFIGHTTGHKCYDRMEGADGLRSTDIDSRSSPMTIPVWMKGHNQHHVHTDVHNLDPDLHHNPALIRLHRGIPWTPLHLFQLPLFVSAMPTSMWSQTLYYHGLLDPLKGRESRFFMPDFDWRDYLARWRRFTRDARNHVAVDYVAFPALAGPLWWKVLAGNMLAESMATMWIGLVVYGTHYGAGVDDEVFFEQPTRDRGEWYLRQLTCTTDIKLPKIFDHQTAGLNLHVCHHLFPALPPNRLIEVKPRVRAVCERYGVPFQEKPVGKVYRNILGRLARNSLPDRVADKWRERMKRLPLVSAAV